MKIRQGLPEYETLIKSLIYSTTLGLWRNILFGTIIGFIVVVIAWVSLTVVISLVLFILATSFEGLVPISLLFINIMFKMLGWVSTVGAIAGGMMGARE